MKGPVKVIATPNIEAANVILYDGHRTLVEGQLVTLLGWEERSSANVLGSDNQPIVKVYFALQECCEACRKKVYHHWVFRKTFDDIFEEYTEADVLIPVKDIIHYIGQITSVISYEKGESFRKVYTDRASYWTLTANNGVSLYVDTGYGKTSIRYEPDGDISEKYVAPLLALYSKYQKKLERMEEIKRMVSLAFKRTKGGEVGQKA